MSTSSDRLITNDQTGTVFDSSVSSRMRHDCIAQQQHDEEIVITAIRATDLTIGLGRIPAGFYTKVQHSDLEWRTPSKHVSLSNDAVVWHGPIPIPSCLSATVHLGLYAPFEFQPTLGRGEPLRELTVTVQQLLDRDEKGLPFAFHPMDGDVKSPCSSMLVTVQRRRLGSETLFAPKVLGPHGVAKEPLDQLEEATNLGHNLFSRYRKYKETWDLERSIQLFEQALNDCPPDHPCHAVAQSNLAMAKFAHYQIVESDLPFAVPISLYQNALVTRPAGHPDRPSTLIQLACVYYTQFERQRDPADAAQAEALLREAVDLTSAESYERRSATSALQLYVERSMDAVRTRSPSSMKRYGILDVEGRDPLAPAVLLLGHFEQSSDPTDLQQAISFLETIVLDPACGPHYPAALGNLGVALLYRFSYLGHPDDLDHAIRRQKEAIDMTPTGHPDRPGRLSNLGNSMLVRFEHADNPVDFEEALSKHKDAVSLISDNHPYKPRHLNNLGNTFIAGLERLDRMEYLDEAISSYREALALATSVNSNKPTYLDSLATSIITRFFRLGEMRDLEEAISFHKQAVELSLDSQSGKPIYLNNFGNALVARFERLGNLNDIEQAISAYQQATGLISSGHSAKPGYLNDLANCFRIRFESLGDSSDLEQAISNHRKIMELDDSNHSNHVYLNSLSTTLLTRFKYFCEPNDLEEAVSGYKKAIELTPDGNRNKAGYLNDFALSLFTRFECHEELSDLEQAVLSHKKAITLASPGRTNHVYLNGLSTSLLARFMYLGDPSNLEQAVSGYREAIKHIPSGHWRKPDYLDGLAASLFIRSNCFGKFDDLDEGIETLREAVILVAGGHANKPDYLNNLAVCLSSRFTRFGRPDDLGEAIARHREAIKCATGRQTKKLNGRKNLVTRFAQHDHIPQNDIERAIALHREVVRLTPDFHWERSRRLRDLANSLVVRYEHIGELKDLEEADLIYKKAVELEDVSSAPTSSAQLGLDCVAAAPTDEPVSEG